MSIKIFEKASYQESEASLQASEASYQASEASYQASEASYQLGRCQLRSQELYMDHNFDVS